MIPEGDMPLLGVSGGVDSMVMLHLFYHSGFRFAVAHCNFGLRGKEADGDEQLVSAYCSEKGIPFHRVNFRTEAYSRENGISIQMAARELRYRYFDKLCKENRYCCVAIAHNRDDLVETLLLNLARGTGLKGLSGIKPISGNVIRPLLFATRKEILAYARERGVEFREDSSNASVKYKRNFIRHRVLPLLRELNPSVDRVIAQTADHLQEAFGLVHAEMERIRGYVLTVRQDEVFFSVKKLSREQGARYFLVEELARFGFSPAASEQAMELLNAETGRKIESSTHILFRNRDSLVLSPKRTQLTGEYEISATDRLLTAPLGLSLEFFPDVSLTDIDPSPDVALLDYDKLCFPLQLRIWQPGDWFIPLGMSGKKKVSDFLVDLKVPLSTKERVFILLSAGEVVWVVGYRIDNRFRITRQSRRGYRISRI